MDLEKIEGLVKIIENSSLTEFTLKEGDMKITMSKLDHPPVVAAGVPAAAAAGAPERLWKKRIRKMRSSLSLLPLWEPFIQLRRRMPRLL